MRTIVLAICLTLSAGAGAAQTVEVGGSVAAGCLGSDGSMCGNGTYPLIGAHASWWFADRVELGVRGARVGLPARHFRLFFAPVDVSVSDRAREFVSGLFLWHFRRGSAVRPMLGLGSGVYRDADRVMCQPAGCEELLRREGLTAGTHGEWDVDAIFVVGLSGIVRDRWVWRGGWQAHRFANDENSTEEFFVGVGYRFRAR